MKRRLPLIPPAVVVEELLLQSLLSFGVDDNMAVVVEKRTTEESSSKESVSRESLREFVCEENSVKTLRDCVIASVANILHKSKKLAARPLHCWLL